MNKNECSIAATGPPSFEGPRENPKSLSSPIARKFEFLLMHSVIFFFFFFWGGGGGRDVWKGVGGVRVRRTMIFWSLRNPRSLSSPKAEKFEFLFLHSVLSGGVIIMRPMALTSLMSSRKPQVSIKSQSWENWIFVFAQCGGGHHHHEADGLDVLDVLAKNPCLYQVPELRYWIKYLVEKNVTDTQFYINRWVLRGRQVWYEETKKISE